MDNLTKLSELLKAQNQIHYEISKIIKRPAQHGHIVEFIAASIFGIQLNQNAAQKGMDGIFTSGLLNGRSVDIKYHSKHEGLLNANVMALPEYFLILAGPKSPAVSSKNQHHPFTIQFVFLLNSTDIIEEATEVGKKNWDSDGY